MKRQKIISLCGVLLLLCIGYITHAQAPITISGPTEVCVNSTETYTIPSPTSGITYSWSTTLGTLTSPANGTSINILWGTATGTATITVNGYDAGNNLVESDTYPVDIYSLAIPRVYSRYRVACANKFTANDTNSSGEPVPDSLFLDDKYGCVKVCENATVIYEAYGSGGSYFWEAFNGTIIGSATSSTVEVEWGFVGSGMLTLNEYIGQCTVKRVICIDIIEKPVSAFSVLPNNSPVENCDTFDLCLDAKAGFKDFSTGSTSSKIVKWYWIFGDGSTSQQQNPAPHAYSAPGVYKVQLVVTNECGCVDTSCAHINVYEDPGPDILCQAVACENDSVEYCTSVRCSSYDWQVVGGTVISNNDTCIKVLWDQLAPEDNFGYISLGVGCDDKCPAYTTIKVPVVKSNPVISVPAKMCANNQYKLSLPLWPGTEYTWGVINDSTPIVGGQRKGNDVILEFATGGTYQIHVTWKNHISLCGGDTTFPVTVSDVDTIDGDKFACKTDFSVTVPYVLRSGNVADWVMTDPHGNVTSLTSTTFNAAFTFVGVYKLVATNVCADPFYITVTELTDIVDTVTGEDTACTGIQYRYTAASTSLGTNFIWEATNGTIVGPNVGASVIVVWNSLSGGTLTVNKKSTSIPYCEGPDYVMNIVTNAMPDITGPDTVCSDSYNGYSSNFGASDATYTWLVIPQTAGNIQSGTYDADMIFKANRVTVNTSVQLVVRVKRCDTTITDTMDVLIKPTILPNIYLSKDTFCNGELVEMTSDPGAEDYHWFFGDQNVHFTDTPYSNHRYWSNDTTFRKIYIHLETYGTDGSMVCPPNGKTYDSIVVRPGPLAIVTTTDTVDYECGQTISTDLSVTVKYNTGSLSYQWYRKASSVGPDVAISGATFSTHTATLTGIYFCIVTDNTTGCMGRSTFIEIDQGACPGGGSTPCPGTLVFDPVTPYNCYEIQFDGSPAVTGPPEYKDPVISANNTEEGQIFSNTGTLTFTSAGRHAVRYSMDIEQVPPGGVFCRKEVVKSVTVPVVPFWKMNVTCGTGEYDIALEDISSFMDGFPYAAAAPNYTTSEWDIATDLAMTNIVRTSGGAITTPFDITPALAPGTYYVRQRVRLYTVTDSLTHAMCPRVMELVIPEWPTVTFDYDPTSVCEGLPVLFTADVTPDPETQVINYLWDFGDLAFSAVNPTYRVYTFDAGGGSPNNYFPTLTITDGYECVHTSAPQQVDIHQNNLDGTVSGGSIVCNGPVTLTYNPESGSTTPIRYLWSDEGIFSTNNTHDVNITGAYYATVEDANFCRFVTAPENVTIISPSGYGISGRTAYCAGEEVFLEGFAGTNVTYIWERDNNPVGGNNPYIFDPGLAPGSYNYTLDIISSYGGTSCTTTVGPVQVDIYNPSAPPTITNVNVLDCQKYELELVGSAPGSGNLQWANGPIGSNYTIYSGGPYRLIFYDANGCVSFEDTLIPPAPESQFGWFPDGCYSLCASQFPFWLYGPLGTWDNWEWRALGGAGTTITGSNSSVPPYQVTVADDYTLTLDNGLCAQTTDVMSITQIPCPGCPDILGGGYMFTCDPTNPGGYNLQLTLNNPFLYDLDVTIGLGSGPSKPFQLTLPNGSHMFNVYVVTMSGPPSEIEIIYKRQPNGRKCFLRIPVDPGMYQYPCTGWPSQKPGRDSTTAISDNIAEIQTGMLLFPNPANQSLTVNYNFGKASTAHRRIAAYDMAGRRVTEVPVTDYDNSRKMDVSNWAQGVYVIRMEEDGRAVQTARITVTH